MSDNIDFNLILDDLSSDLNYYTNKNLSEVLDVLSN